MRVRDELSRAISKAGSMNINEAGSERNIEHSSPYRIAKLELTFIIKEFFYIFGTQTTTNHDLMRYAKMLKIKIFHVVMSDEVKELPENNFSAILNIQLSSENGSHWVSSYQRDDETLYYFDSYGTPVQKQVIDKFLRSTKPEACKYIRTSDFECVDN